MGLSDEERLSGIAYAVKSLNQIKKDWEDDRQVSDYAPRRKIFLDLIDQTWHALFGGQSNGLHWVFGSSSSQSIVTDSPSTPWELAIHSHLLDLEIDPEGVKTLKLKESDRFDAKKYNSINSLVSRNDRDDGYVFKIYQWVEQGTYYTRRYHDKFTKKFAALDEIFSKLFGECMVTFKGNSDFAKAYLIQQSMEIIYGPRYPYNEDEYDVVTKLADKHSFHHDLAKCMDRQCSLEALSAIHVELVKTKVATEKRCKDNGQQTVYDWYKDVNLLKARLFALLKMVNGFYEYEHIRKECLAELTKSPLKPFIKEIKAEIEVQLKLRTEAKAKDKSEREDEYLLNQLNVYGYDGYFLLSRHLEAKPPVKKSSKKKKRKK